MYCNLPPKAILGLGQTIRKYLLTTYYNILEAISFSLKLFNILDLSNLTSERCPFVVYLKIQELVILRCVLSSGYDLNYKFLKIAVASVFDLWKQN